jgi:phytanoyl-CoA hydroxylase
MQALNLSAKKFAQEGYLVVRGLAPADLRAEIRGAVEAALNPLEGPAEFEAEVGYTGAPRSRDAPGGDTPRRLLNAYSRDAVFKRWAASVSVRDQLRELMGVRSVAMSQCHHNCVMTKHPGFSSETLWHQDIRYWSFDRPELVSVWLALGSETADNGALWVIPGSHQLELDRGRFDAELFLRPELPENRELIDAAQVVELDAGDVLFFHCRLFHAAGMNRTSKVKLSLVGTYHDGDNAPIPGTRSALYPSVAL